MSKMPEGFVVPTYEIEAVHLGPTWERGEDGRFVLPKLSLGWHIIKWAETELLGPDGNPWRFTREQARFILHWYAVDERGKFTWRDGIFQRIKGHGKDPLAAVIALIELVGPCRFKGFAIKDDPEMGVKAGDPVGKDNKVAWVQIAAVSASQTKNTMLCFPWMISDDFKKKYRMTIGKEIIYSHGGARRIEAVTSSPRTLEGGRPTFVIRNETHHWITSNEGHEMAAVIERNATKSTDGSARALSITNAYAPHEDSVAQKQREAWENEQSGLSPKTGVLYDSLEAPETLGLKPPRPDEIKDEEFDELYFEMIRAWLAAIIVAVRGDAVWLDVERITNSILDKNNPISRSKRFWLNVITTTEDTWLVHEAIKASISRIVAGNRDFHHDQLRVGWLPLPDEEIVVFGDGSKSDDATALVGCRLSDGYTFLIGVWQKPTGERGKGWLAPRADVDARVVEMMERFNVVGFWFDPSHAKDDEDDSRYWDGLIDEWMQRYASRLSIWPTKTGHKKHAIMFDMASPLNSGLFVAAAETFVEEMEAQDDIEEYAPLFETCGNPAFVNHMQNARIYPTKWGTSLSKEGRESLKKIDAAVCGVGARMMRRLYRNDTVELEKPRTGVVWGV